MRARAEGVVEPKEVIQMISRHNEEGSKQMEKGTIQI